MMLREAGETLPGLADLSLRRGETSCQRGERRRGRRLDQAELNFPPVLKCIFFSFLNATLPFGGAGQQVRGLVRSDCASFSLEYERPFDLFVVCWMFFFFLLISMFLASGINPCSSWSILDRLVRCVRRCQLFAGCGRKGHCPPRCQRSLTSSVGERCPPQCRLSQRERENQVRVGRASRGWAQRAGV